MRVGSDPPSYIRTVFKGHISQDPASDSALNCKSTEQGTLHWCQWRNLGGNTRILTLGPNHSHDVMLELHECINDAQHNCHQNQVVDATFILKVNAINEPLCHVF